MNKRLTLQAVKFTLFSASAGIIQFASEMILEHLCGFQYYASYAIALTLSVVWNFTFNRRFTFKSAANVPIAMLKVFGFYLVFAPASTYLGNLAVEGAGINSTLVLIITMLCNLVLEFLFCKLVVYRGREDTL